MSGFCELLGLAPNGRIAVCEALLAGVSSVEDLVGASGLPRRDVEEFTAALPADYGPLLAEYRASRARVTDGPGLERVAAGLIAEAPAPLKRLDHVQATPDTLVRRVKWLTDTFDLRGRSCLFIGDHDVTSLLLARVAPESASLTVADIDERLLEYVGSASGGRVRGAWADFRFGLPPCLEASADIIVTDPPYTAEGLGLFLSRSLEALRREEPEARILIAYGYSRRRPDLGVAAQREILRHDVAVDAMIPAFSRYDGAQAVGSVSDWYSCQPTSRAFRRVDGSAAGQPGIYTRGEQSVESGLRSAAELPDLGPSRPAGLVSPEPGATGDFAVTVSLGKLLADGVHPSVTGRAAEFVVDLRDDPGPWLLRAMLALNAPRAVFVVRARHQALARLASADLPGAKYASVSSVPLGDLVAVRCELASGESDDPGLELARFVARRAHGRLRNVWREGLVHGSGGSLTKRQATGLVERYAGEAGIDPDLRLIDVPAHRFPAVHSALTASLSHWRWRG